MASPLLDPLELPSTILPFTLSVLLTLKIAFFLRPSWASALYAPTFTALHCLVLVLLPDLPPAIHCFYFFSINLNQTKLSPPSLGKIICKGELSIIIFFPPTHNTENLSLSRRNSKFTSFSHVIISKKQKIKECTYIYKLQAWCGTSPSERKKYHHTCGMGHPVKTTCPCTLSFFWLKPDTGRSHHTSPRIGSPPHFYVPLLPSFLHGTKPCQAFKSLPHLSHNSKPN